MPLLDDCCSSVEFIIPASTTLPLVYGVNPGENARQGKTNHPIAVSPSSSESVSGPEAQNMIHIAK